jgi:hypothetical protein
MHNMLGEENHDSLGIEDLLHFFAPLLEKAPGTFFTVIVL